MATVDLTDVRPNKDSFAEDRLGPPAELWAAPLAPIGDEDGMLPTFVNQVIYPKRLDPADS
jgi:hypothetical protein